MPDPLVVAARFNGPPTSGNGGYTCGLVAEHVPAEVAEVTLRLPPPLDVPLEVHRGPGEVAVRDGDRLVATARPGAVDLAAPEPVPVAVASRAEAAYGGLSDHPFGTCYVCGVDRVDGLGLRPGPVDDGVAATTWTPGAELADGPVVRPEFVWAALDCPGGWALTQASEGTMVLGRLTARLLAPVRAGETHVVTGWAMGGERRKRYAGTAVFGADGTLEAIAHATWVLLEPAGPALH